jgi:hypothetical protein
MAKSIDFWVQLVDSGHHGAQGFHRRGLATAVKPQQLCRAAVGKVVG